MFKILTNRQSSLATLIVLTISVGAIFMQGCISTENWEIGVGRVDDPTSDDPEDSGWGIVIRPTGSNPDFEDTNEQNGNICVTCEGNYTYGPGPDPNDPGAPGGCSDTFWGCEDEFRLDFGASSPLSLNATLGTGTIYTFSSTGSYISQQNHSWSASGTKVGPTNPASLSGMIDYNVSQGNVVVYEALVPMDVYASQGTWVVQHGSLEFGNEGVVSSYNFFTSNGESCQQQGGLPYTYQQACLGN